MFAILIIAALAVALFFFLKPSQQEKKEQAELEERLKDERIYDSVSGRYLTLEEAENEVIHADELINRIKSDQEIEENYSEDDREVQYILRDMIQTQIPETEDDRIFELIDYSKLFESYNEYATHFLWTIKPDHFLGLVYVTYSYRDGRSQSSASEYQLVGIGQGKDLNKELKNLNAIEIMEINNTQIFRIGNKVKCEVFRVVQDLILRDG